MDGNPRSRNGLGGSSRPSNEARRLPTSSASSMGTASTMSRAERFDDERRRITESCFSKVDEQGQLIESYITHIRVQEDASHPQSPPPPNSNPSTKKPRVIIVSVRATGRVRLHKARENANGSFSIGKTWNMEELSGVENFVHMNPKNEVEANHQKWAGDIGFLVTIQKPYYWEAGTAKEKEFFIGSMIKIFHKYTQGDFPALTGFSTAELNGLTGGRPELAAPGPRGPRRGVGASAGSPALAQSQTPQVASRSPLPPGIQGTPSPGERRPPPMRNEARPPPGVDDNRRPPPRRPPTSEGERERRPPPLRGPGQPGRPLTGEESRRPPPIRNGTTTPLPLRSPQSREQMNMRSPPSRDGMRSMLPPASVPTPPIPSSSSQRPSPKSSRSDLRPKTPDSVSSLSIAPGRRPQADDARSQMSQRSQKSVDDYDASEGGAMMPEQRKPNGAFKRDPSPRGLRPGTAQSNASSAFSRNEEPASEERAPSNGPPERRRPPMLTPSQQSLRGIGVDSNKDMPLSPPTPLILQAGRRPQEFPDMSKPAPVEDAVVPSLPQALPESIQPLNTLASPKPFQLPPTSPLPQIPRAMESKESLPQAPSVEQSPIEPQSATTDNTASPTIEDENATGSRPGLGPMIKSKMGVGAKAKSNLRQAAVAMNAFKPRAGGGGVKMMNLAKTETTNQADGINAVFVPQRPTPKEEVEEKVEPEQKPAPDQTSNERPHVDTEVPSVTVSSPLSPSPTPVSNVANTEDKLPARSPSPETTAPKAEVEVEVRRRRRRSNHQITNISRLGIDPDMLDNRGLEFESLLGEFGWGSSDISAKSIETLQSDIKREIARVEAGSWLNHLDQKDDRVEAVEKMLDRAIAECDELEGLLTLYNVELSSLNDDIAFIEAQSQGLQVQTANQRLLQTELQQLVSTISITSDQLEPLRRAQIGKVNGLKAIESSLVLLYKALVTIDPAFIEAGRSNTAADPDKTNNNSGFGNSELATMQALQEKKERYLNESAMFLDRLKKHMDITFGAAFMDTKDALSKIDRSAMPSTESNIEAHDIGRNELWKLSPVILFAKEIDRSSWGSLIRVYQAQAGQVYQDEIRDNISAWKGFARKITGDEQDLLFTAQEKETESFPAAARKLTVKRSQTLARGLRAASGDKEPKVTKAQEGRLYAYDVFSRILEDMGPILLTEQNFVSEFFHATSTNAVDFPEAVSAAPPEERGAPNLRLRKPFESDRTMAKQVAEVMEDIFSFWPAEIQGLVGWAVKADPLQGVGIICAIDRKLVEIEDSNQDFLTRTLQKVHESLTGLFVRFVDEQIRAIEDTKVKIKKRKGVIAFFKTFPHFSVAIENMLPAADEDSQLEIRRMVDDAYQKINKAMFESVKVIAKESPAVMASQGQGDPEDKEALNYHILLIENMNHYIEEVDARADTVLTEWKVKAENEMKEHMGLYVDAVIRRPLGKLLEFVESTETLLAQSGSIPQAVATRSSHSRSIFKKLLHANDAKEIRKGIEALKKRVDKHFGDADDPGLSRDLVFKVLKECERKYSDAYDRTIHISQDVYGGEVDMDWGIKEVETAFRR
ncbi:hypothetical protein K504DRAFT_459588 [Pleomassaria siparia CBS 279.74]|uniref:Exocyst complex component Sec3 PIP2-binding N-terminal domain-containing protein n=1 Tax=Pleomassaria siparia CBS 279.74 TaxID=1314801 RepID=A0A6G1K183_9PLEO|nr:hypothetical protein K504DRAFT_459588 [Pleomassaria siparia CBS 279.74]